jgi:hypothetical protein
VSTPYDQKIEELLAQYREQRDESAEFPTGAYRRMAPKELADLLITTIQEARAKALEQVGEVVSTELPEGVTMSDLLQGRVQPAAVLTEEPAMPASVREYIDHGHSGV